MLQHARVFFQPNLIPGLCNSHKRVSCLPMNMKSHGGFSAVRCEASVQLRDDAYYMRRCVDLARKATGHTSPNPMVGCVIVKDGEVVGEGFHPKAGQPHAEVFALKDAGDLSENATAFVSLEPCNHYGRTPPCTEALINAKVRKVVVGMVDPNTIVASKGINRLQDAGIDVVVGVEEEACKKLNEAYIHQMLTGYPFVAMRYSVSLNGCLLDLPAEDSLKAGGYFSKLLEEYDAVISSLTSFTDRCLFPLSNEPGANQPYQILLAKSPTSISIPDLTADAAAKLIIVTDKEDAVEPELTERGTETLVSNPISLCTILDYCKQRGLNSVLLDVRAKSSDFRELLLQGFNQNLVQKFFIEVLPVWDDTEGGNSLLAYESLVKRPLEILATKKQLSGKRTVIELAREDVKLG